MNVSKRIRSILMGGIVTLLFLSALLPIGCRSKTEESEQSKPAAGSRQSYTQKGIRPQKARFSRKIEE